MNSRIPFLCLLTTYFVLLPLTCVAEKITVVSPRSFNDAILLLQGQLQCVITFEDAPYEYESRVEEMYPGGRRIPRERIFEFTFRKTDTPIELIKDMLKQYHELDDSAIFVVNKDPTYDGVFHIYPKEYRNKKGEYVAFKSLLEGSISLSIQAGATLNQSIEELCQLISTHEIALDDVGNNVNGYLSEIKLTNVLARNYLMYILQEIAGQNGREMFSFFIRRGPSDSTNNNMAVLEIHNISSSEYLGENNWLYVESMRPIFSAMKVLNGQSDGSIIYEDPQYVCPCDVIRDSMGKPRVPSGGKIVCGYNSNSSRLKIAQTFIDSYNSQNDTCKYNLHASGDNLHIYPGLFRNDRGEEESWVSLLSKRVEPMVSTISTKDYINGIVNEISEQRSITIKCGDISEYVERLRGVPESCKTVVQVLHYLGENISHNTIWKMSYDPIEAGYSLSVIAGIQKEGKKGGAQ